MTRRILRAFGAAQRPVSWAILALTPFVVAGVIADVVDTGKAKIGTVLIALVLMRDALGGVMEVENELDSDAAASD